MIRVDAVIDADRATDAFKTARRDIGRRARSGTKRAGEQTILPRGQRSMSAKTPIAPSQLIVKTTTTDGYLTVQGRKQDRVVGLLNFGGTIQAPIKPKKKKALSFGGVVVAQVSKARRYDGAHFLEKARDEGLDEFGMALLPQIMLAFEPLEHTP